MEVLITLVGLFSLVLLLTIPLGIILAFISFFKSNDLARKIVFLEQELARLKLQLPEPDIKPITDSVPVAPQIRSQAMPAASQPVTVKQLQTPVIQQPAELQPQPAFCVPNPPQPVQQPGENIPEQVPSQTLNTDQAGNSQIVDLQQNTANVLTRICNWLCVGEEYRSDGVSREYAVATTWLIRLGVLTLLFGIGFFLKYSIDRNWLSPLIRVSGMTVAGIAAAAFGLWQQSGKYRQMAIAAIGGGFTVLYLSVLAAYKLYAMLPDTAAFTLMVIITAAAMLSSIYSKALLAAMIGCIGGFLTPDFIYSGNMTGNTLMIYLTIISAGVLLISVFRDWILLNITALFFYAIFSWSIKADNDLIFNTLLMLNFVIYALQPAMTARKRDISILGMIFLAVNWSLGYFNGAANCSYAQYQYTELFIALSAIVSVGLIYIFKSCKLLANRPCFAGVFFLQSAISLALLVPELLKNAPACTLIAAWCLLALFFTWWGLFERSRTLIVCSQLLMLFTFIYEIIFPASFNVQFDSYLQAITTRMTVWGSFIAALTLIGTSMCYYSKRNTDRPFFVSAAGIFNLNQAFLLFALYSGAEIFYLLKHLACFNDYHTCIISSYWSVLAAVSAWCSRKLNRPKCLVATLVLVLINTVFLLTNEEPYIIKADYFKSLLYMIFTGVTYTGTLFFAGRQISKFKQPEKFSTLYRIVYLVAGLLAFAISSSELFALLDLYLKHFRDGGLSVYWSILAFCLIFRGIKKRIKALRISGILLFILTAVKVFFQDLSGLQQLWRIVAFVIIGAAMLVGAVIYIKCKDMFVENIDDQSDKDQ